MNITDPEDVPLTLAECVDGFNDLIEEAVMQGVDFDKLSYTLLLVLYRKGITKYGNFIQTASHITRLNATMLELGPRLEAEAYGHKIH